MTEANPTPTGAQPPADGLADPPRKKRGRGVFFVLGVFVLLGLLLGILVALGAIGWIGAERMLDNVDVTIEDVDIAFLDKKKKKIRLSPTTVLNPQKTASRIRKGWLKVTLHLEATNKNPVPVVAEKVNYKVWINKVYAGKGELPEKGEEAIVLPPEEIYEREVSIRIKSKRVIKGGTAKIVKGVKFVIKVKGTAEASLWGISLERPFSVTKTKKWGLPGAGKLPLPLPLPAK